MLPITYGAIKALLRADPSVLLPERTRLLALLRNGTETPKPKATAESVARIIRRAETAERLSCSVRTVDKLHAQGILRKHKLPGRSRSSGFLESDLVALITAESAQGQAG